MKRGVIVSSVCDPAPDDDAPVAAMPGNRRRAQCSQAPEVFTTMIQIRGRENQSWILWLTTNGGLPGWIPNSNDAIGM
jgi:hypothetical protein